MNTLYIDRPGYELRWREGALQLRRDGELERSVPAALLQRVVLRADTLLSSATLAALADADIGLLAFGGRGGQRVAQLMGKPGADARLRLAQCDLALQEGASAAIAARLVRAKLLGQARLLRRALAQRPDLRKPLLDGLETLGLTLAQLRGAAASALPIGSLRGLEGAGAAAYFRAYQQLFAPALGFVGRRRRPPPDPVNAALSLGYTLLHAQAAQVLWSQGLDPALGFLHAPAYSRASLACDLMEPWRVQVDQLVWDAFRERTLRPEHFGRDGAGACLMGKQARAALYPLLHLAARRSEPAMRRTARALARALLANSALAAACGAAAEAEDGAGGGGGAEQGEGGPP